MDFGLERETVTFGFPRGISGRSFFCWCKIDHKTRVNINCLLDKYSLNLRVILRGIILKCNEELCPFQLLSTA